MGISAFLNGPRRATALLALASAAIGSTALLAPSASARSARNNSGGSALGGSGAETTTGTSTTTTATSPTVTTNGTAVIGMTVPLQATGGGITVTLAAFGTLHHALKIAGSAPAADAGSTIDIEVAAASGVPIWTEVATATVGSTGDFSSVWVPTQSAAVDLKAVLATAPTSTAAGTPTSTTGGGALPDAATAASGPQVSATGAVVLPIFKDAIATLYGPGLWGRHTACGQVLKRTTLGVASRTLKCGTMVAVYYGGRELSVPVIDRGPFANHASWDLTLATARLLGVRETSTVGTLATPPASLVPAVRVHH